MKHLRIMVTYDDERDQLIFDTPFGLHAITATNDGETWKSVGEALVRDVKAFGR